MAAFVPSQFLPDAVLARLTDLRVSDPERVVRAAGARKRRATLTLDGRLNVLAADHPARRVTAVGEDPLAMADRRDYLARVVRVLLAPSVDGVMATMDILEDLLLLDGLLCEAGAPPLLEGRLLIASLNRGGLSGASWELDDRITGATPAACAERGLDGAKLLLRLCDEEAASLETMAAAARAISELNHLRLPAFLEALPVVRAGDRYEVCRDAAALARTAGVASALGDSSRYLWLKLPYCEGFERVARATTLPILILGGEATGGPAPLLRQVAAALAAGPNVRGAMIGRNTLYPGDGDPLALAEAFGRLIHERCDPTTAAAVIAEQSWRNMDAITRWLKG
ncbi:MAG: hypothetical protein Q7T33_14320 [Dehalococcoidia bacterium]|nr:hypothetical protein [Dehalococcoidia bacterium]